MELIVKEKAYEVNYSIGERNLLIMSDVPIEGIESLCGTSPGEGLPLCKELVEATYHFATQTAQEAELSAALAKKDVAIAEKESAIAEQVRVAVSLREELIAKDKEFDEVLLSVREGLKGAPVAGEEWDAEKWYVQGDTAKQGTVLYEAQRTCKGREPAVSPIFWQASPVLEKESVAVVEWSSIKNGEVITVGTVVTRNDTNWRCIKEHKKAIAQAPADFTSEYWAKL